MTPDDSRLGPKYVVKRNEITEKNSCIDGNMLMVTEMRNLNVN
jgi:hypothetical protein